MDGDISFIRECLPANNMLNCNHTIKLYMRRFLIIMMCFMPFISFSQGLKERRVYYLDCTESLVTNGIWDLVRDNLKNAIDQVNDETTELLVIPFTDDQAAGFKPPLRVYQEMATQDGKAKLKKAIDTLVTTAKTYTSHYVPLNDFTENRIDPNRVTYMFLMTDGQTNRQEAEFKQELEKWGARFGSKNVYGFYVLLYPDAKNTVIEDIVKGQDHLWQVETADVNVNLIRLDNEAVYNVRNDEYVDIPIYGTLNGVTLTASGADGDYEVGGTSIVGGKLRVAIKPKKDVSNLPAMSSLTIKVSKTKLPPFSFLVTNRVDIKCINQKEYSLKVRVE